MTARDVVPDALGGAVFLFQAHVTATLAGDFAAAERFEALAEAECRRVRAGLEAEPAPPSRHPTPALDAWHARLRTGYGGQHRACRTWVMDALWRAACAEQSALEAATPEVAERLLSEARSILIDAAKVAA